MTQDEESVPKKPDPLTPLISLNDLSFYSENPSNGVGHKNDPFRIERIRLLWQKVLQILSCSIGTLESKRLRTTWLEATFYDCASRYDLLVVPLLIISRCVCAQRRWWQSGGLQWPLFSRNLIRHFIPLVLNMTKTLPNEHQL